MFQRLKGAIDSRIAEEQARQRQAALSAASPRPATHRRPLQQNGSTPRLSSRQRMPDADSTYKSPDPAEFEPDFVIGDDHSAISSRVGTPAPEVQENEVSGDEQTVQVRKDGETTGEEGAGKEAINLERSLAPQLNSPEMDVEIPVKLRRLEKLESKYPELLKAYRIAHTRVQTIEPFEASLREHTPLTSINDPAVFIEYINQLSLKSDMVLDELKRVTTDRDEIKKKYAHSEDVVSQLQVDLRELKTETSIQANVLHQHAEKPADSIADDKVEGGGLTESGVVVKSPVSISSRIPSLSLFSPRSKATSPPIRHASEDLFSYDSEVPRLENDLQESQREVETLKKQTQKLQEDLAVTRESTEGMAQSLEEATRELHHLREARDNFDARQSDMDRKYLELETSTEADRHLALERQSKLNQLQAEKEKVSETLDRLETQLQELQSSRNQLKEELEAKDRETRILNEKLSQKDATVKELEDSLAMAKSAERQELKSSKEAESTERKLATMQGIMKDLRMQLDSSEATVKQTKQDTELLRAEFSARPSSKVFGFLDQNSQISGSSLQSQEDVISFLAQKFKLQKDESNPLTTKTSSDAVVSLTGTSNAGKKKNKKKKKGKGTQSGNNNLETDVPVKVSEDLDDLEDSDHKSRQATVASTSQLEHDIQELREEVHEKSRIIDKLTGQVKDQEALQEEIETLRDDLLHQGEEHVEARDALKRLQAEKTALEEVVQNLRSEISDAKKTISHSTMLESSFKDLSDKFEDLTLRSETLRTDLAAAEQLAAARFKDIGDLKDLLSKTQPELRSLRSEASELKSVKEELKNKTGELKRLETRYEDLKLEMKAMGKRLGDKDLELKGLHQKLEEEINAKARAEDVLRSSQSELESAESQYQEILKSTTETTREFAKVKEERTALKHKLRDLEEQTLTLDKQVNELKDEILMKTALHSSGQTLLQSLRDQTHELSTQAREAINKAETLEEELTEAQKMLSERTREGQTMRMLLNQAETRTESRLREMKERMDSAIEERDRTEDEASVSNRRMMREVEDAKTKARDAQRELKSLQDEKDDLVEGQREWKKKKDELGKVAETALKEADEVRHAMSGLREALDENERQVRELETQKTDLRKTYDEAKEKIERLTKANKSLTEDLKMTQLANRKGNLPIKVDSSVQSSSRSSMDSGGTRSPVPNIKERERVTNAAVKINSSTEANQGPVDFVYLKNVLLQFMEQKDKGHQKQLIPVLGMLLHFDRKDEQRWASAIAAR